MNPNMINSSLFVGKSAPTVSADLLIREGLLDADSLVGVFDALQSLGRLSIRTKEVEDVYARITRDASHLRACQDTAAPVGMALQLVNDLHLMYPFSLDEISIQPARAGGGNGH
jgi:hypothetical protein